MRPKAVIVTFALIAVVAITGGLALSQRAATAGKRSFEVRGVIESIDVKEKTVRIRHEEIPDYMPAMIMPFYFREPSLLRGLAPGDAVEFRLEVSEESAWVSRIRRVETEAALDETQVAVAAVMPGAEFERLQIGEKVPAIQLTDQNGKPMNLGDYRGKVVLLTFIYTRCPIPNYCPFLSKGFAELQRRLTREFPGQFHLLTITIDPDVDTPPVLKAYGMRYGADELTWSFATGPIEEIERAGRLFGLTQVVTGGLIDHDLRTALIGPDGTLLQVWKSNSWTPYELHRSVRKALTGSID